MTLGIVGCNTNENVQSMAMLMDARASQIAADISRGHGENLEAMAVTLGIEPKDREAFYQVLSKNFTTIYPNEDTTSGEAVNAIVALMERDRTLGKYVSA
jgi:hypothetical protein